MSYDFYFETDLGAGVVPVGDCQLGYTSNVGPMLHDVMKYKYKTGIQAFDGMAAGNAAFYIGVGLGVLRSDPAKYKKMNPANGWGSYDGLCDMLGELMTECDKYPNATFRVSC